MGQMVERAVDVLGQNGFTALYDKGYHTSTELKQAAELGVEVLVAIPAVSSHAPDPVFDVSRFTYVAAEDYYVCPIGQHLRTNGRWYGKAHGKITVQVKHYKTEHCLKCDFAARCTRNKAGRLIEWSEYAPYYEANAKRIQTNEPLYKRRQAIVEHGYGILKRQWGFYFISTKMTIEHAAADVGLMFTAFNLRRIFNLIPKKVLQAYLKRLAFIFDLLIALLQLIRAAESPLKVQLRTTDIFSMLPSKLIKMSYIG
jgi:hypothetical protein